MRLYKLNPSTGGYEAHAGGTPLGCVIVGSGVTYQLLIYNAQKAPQATSPIGGSFTYNLRDLYVSFTDATRNNWSILFDNADTLTTFTKSMMAILCHVKCHAPAEGNHRCLHHIHRSYPMFWILIFIFISYNISFIVDCWSLIGSYELYSSPGEVPSTVKGSLPPLADADPPGTSPMASGVVAGVAYRAYEIAGSSSENPMDILNMAPFLQATASDLAKIKYANN